MITFMNILTRNVGSPANPGWGFDNLRCWTWRPSWLWGWSHWSTKWVVCILMKWNFDQKSFSDPSGADLTLAFSSSFFSVVLLFPLKAYVPPYRATFCSATLPLRSAGTERGCLHCLQLRQLRSIERFRGECQNPYNHNPYCVEILIGFLEILIGTDGTIFLALSAVGILIFQ